MYRNALRAACLLVLSLVCLSVSAGAITGQIQTAAGGAIANGMLTFVLSQPAAPNARWAKEKKEK